MSIVAGPANTNVSAASSTMSEPERRRIAVATGRGNLERWRNGLIVAGAGAVLLFGMTATSTLRYGLIIGVIYAIAVLGSNAVTGVLGEINLAQGAYMAIGAYVSVYLIDAGWGVLAAVVAATAGAGALGILVAIPTVRLEGIFTALVTFALAFAVPDLVVELDSFTGGQAGRPVPFDATLFGVPVGGSSVEWLAIVLTSYALLALAFTRLLHSDAGRIALTVSEAGPAAECFGVRGRFVEVLIWGMASAVGGLAGAFFGMTVGYLTPELFPVVLSILILVGTVLGGSRSALGALIGGLFIGAVPPELQNVIPPEATGMLFGVALYLMLLAGGRGAGGLLESAATGIAEFISRRRTA